MGWRHAVLRVLAAAVSLTGLATAVFGLYWLIRAWDRLCTGLGAAECLQVQGIALGLTLGPLGGGLVLILVGEALALGLRIERRLARLGQGDSVA